MNDKTGTYPVPENALEHAATYKERVGHAQVGDRVRILSGKLPQMGRLGLVTDVDHDDEKFSFGVRTDDGNANWCYDVERVATPTVAIPTGLDAYKALVRKVALRIAAEQGWCDEGLAAAMEELGINVTNTYRVTTRFYGYQDVTVDVEAFDEDRARDAAYEEALEARNGAEWTYRNNDEESEVRSFRLMS